MGSYVERTCVGCRVRAEAHSLVRVVDVEGVATVDVERHLPGRGAHLHPDPACLALALRRRSLSRALRVTELDVRLLTTHSIFA